MSQKAKRGGPIFTRPLQSCRNASPKVAGFAITRNQKFPLVQVHACLLQITTCSFIHVHQPNLTDRFQRAARARSTPLGSEQEKMTAHLCHNGQPDEGHGQSFPDVELKSYTHVSAEFL